MDALPLQCLSLQDYLFRDRWIGLFNEVERQAWDRSEVRELRIPSAIGGAIGAAIGALGGPIGAMAGNVAGTLVQHLGEQLAAGRLGARAVHVDQYRRLTSYLSSAARHDRSATPLREKVERVFGRSLAIDDG